jgi:hypothetical protein
MRTQIRALATAVAISAAYLFSSPALGEDSAAPVGSALSTLESWLGPGANGTAWANYLHLQALHAELAKNDAADPAAIAATLKQLDSQAAGLELDAFVNLRDSLRLWSETLAVAQAPGLPEAAVGSAENFHPITAADVAKDKAALAATTTQLDQYLTPGGANGAAWKKYLHWDDLETQLKSDAPDAAALSALHDRLTADHEGLELPIFANVATALARFLNDAAALKADLRAQYVAHLNGLAEELKQYADGHAEETAVALGGRLGWLEDMRQAVALVQAVRNRYSHPNLHVEISTRLVAAGIDQPVDETAPIVDVILGTDISGSGRTIGKIAVQLLPSDDKATLETTLVGTTSSRTVGRNGPATIFADGTTQIRGSKRMVIDANGFASYPATATAATKTQITGVSARLGIIERIATKKVYKSKSQAEQVGSSHAAQRVRHRVDSQASEQLSNVHGQYVSKFRNPLLRRNEFPAMLNFSTTKDSLFLAALQADRNQLGAPSAPPDITVVHDMAVQIHESLINNLTAALLGGLTLKEEDLQRKVIELRGSLPEQLKSDEDRDPWSITFAKARPVTVKFADNGFQVTVRGQRYTSGEREFRAMNVTAEYKFEISGAGSRFVRQGDLQIVPPGFAAGQTLSVQQVTLKTLLQRKFGKLFEPEIKSEGLVLPGRWRDAGRLDIKQLQAGGGWLVMAWIESGVPASPETAPAKVAQTEP